MLAAAMLAASLCVSCQASKPVEIAKPGGVDLDAAAEIGPNGNGLWLLDGPVAASSVAWYSAWASALAATTPRPWRAIQPPNHTGSSRPMTKATSAGRVNSEPLTIVSASLGVVCSGFACSSAPPT